MKLSDHKKTISGPLRQATLCFLIKGDEVLLAMKKRGFGEGRWNGTGGKPHDGEDINSTAIRETEEEIGVKPKNLTEVAKLDFYFPHNADWNQQVVVYLAQEWDGEPKETEEMLPKWYPKNQLPFDSMWPDDPHWLPPVLAGKKIKAEFLFGEGDKVLDYKVTQLN
jgi:8-oxo-dGTP pyrophosphatase MutT (NUDIX family)